MKRALFFLFTALSVQLVNAQNVGIGTTTPNSSAMLEISSSNKGLLLPRVADTSAVASPAKGLIIYNNTNNKLWYYDGSRWQQSVANGGGMDSIWYKTKDTIAYTAKPFVAINTELDLIAPQANLQVTGSLLVQGKLNYSNASPVAGQIYTMNNTGTTQNIANSDSVYRLYDPGGTGNYNNNMQGNVYYYSSLTGYTGTKISSIAADFGIGAGDTLWISSQLYPGCRSDYEFRFTNTQSNPADFILNTGTYYFIFRSNADNINDKGFNFLATRLFSKEIGFNEQQAAKPINTSGAAFLFNTGNASLSAGLNASATAPNSIAIGYNAKASDRYALAIGRNARTTGQSGVAIGNGASADGFSLALGEGATAMGGVAIGYATATGGYAFGYQANASVFGSTAIGYGADANAQFALALGGSANGYVSVAMPTTYAEGDRAITMGFQNIGRGYSGTVTGIYNDPILASPETAISTTTPLFIIGNGNNNSARSNAMVALKNGNIGIGTNTPAVKLEVNNGDALIHGLTIGRGGGSISGNTAIGALSMENNTTGYYNTGVGYNSLHENTTGISNIAIGTSSLRTNVAGNNAVSIGTNAMYYANNTSTSFTNHNIAIGYEALRGSATPANNTGDNNSVLGYQAMQSNTGGDNNTAIGYVALISNTSGSSNTSIGYGSINNNTTGSFNTALGRSAYFDLAALENTTCIGANSGGIVDVSNRIEIGNTSVTAIAGQVSFSTYSDGRIKDNIRTDVPGLSFINRLRPVSYNLNIHRQNEMIYDKERIAQEWASKYDIEKMRMTGFIAQEVEQAAREINFDFSGVQSPVKTSDLYSLRYSDFVMPLVKAAQELSIENIELKKQIEEMKARLEKLEAAVLKK